MQSPFFYEDGDRLYVARRLTIDLLFTEDIDIEDMMRQGAEFIMNISTIGKGSSALEGIPKEFNLFRLQPVRDISTADCLLNC